MELFSAVWLCIHLAVAVKAVSESHAETLSVSVPFVNIVCPEGADVTILCKQSDGHEHPIEHLQHVWLFNSHIEQHCQKRLHPPSSTVYKAEPSFFSVTLFNVTRDSQGRYCCLALDVLRDGHHKQNVQHRAHSHVILNITPRRNDSQKCIELTAPTPQVQGTVAAGLATAACIMGILCLPVLLILVYRQRQISHGSRRAQELVRMDSEAQGHSNPVYMGDSPKPPSRTVAQILTRQSSESGRHLLSDPGTPFSPNPQGDVFFPAHEPIPESPDI